LKLSQHLGLVLVDRTGDKPKIKRPRLRIRPDAYGVVVDVWTVTGVGIQEWQKVARHLSDDWRAVRVAITQPEPGRIRVRAVRRDPLTTPTRYVPPSTGEPIRDVRQVTIGTDEYATPVPLRLDGVSGIVVTALPGYGKSSLTNTLIAKLAPSPAVQFVVLDGKADGRAPREGDYYEVADRCTTIIGDDLASANELLRALDGFRSARAASIRALLGDKNMWHVGPSEDWPLVVTIIDEAHTYFDLVRDGGDKELRARNALASQNALHVQDLIKRGRSVGMLTVVMTQKGTGDAIPTSIRDVCSVSIAFAARTMDAAIAALGEEIREYPEANPVALQDPSYIGVATMRVQGRIGYTRVRMPETTDRVAGEVAQATRHLVRVDGQLPPTPATPVHALTNVEGS
jgi:S-DNA-T family DNA segregation ATPase FtsK/SpoIIIE